ncbi:anaerobic C4-dicarboxylate transporter [Vibrio maerlii]|uniref:anaerobic C4-dicarboxylate transporter n=1 Tax=Vibrio maerlii TaxID=2231648 RepID=UPI000E3E5A33|nr:anaerobic C4-dicarboxylate transporter [Vibrio maerlii]
MFSLHLALLLIVIFVGIRYGGVAFGLLGGMGVTIMGVFFDVPAGSPPVSVMLIILAVVAASATLEVTGGLNLLVKLAEKILRKNPDRIVYLAPITTWSLTALVGTGHSVYPLLPVIYDVAYSKGIRPERVMPMSTVASQMGITASPLSAAVAVMVTASFNESWGIGLGSILAVTIPATFVGVLVGATISLKKGKELEFDDEFKKRCEDPEFRANLVSEATTTEQAPEEKKIAKRGLSIFLSGIAVLVTVALFGMNLLPAGTSLGVVIQMLMLTVGAVILMSCKVDTKKIVRSNVFIAGMSALVTIFGIAWLSDTIISHHKEYIIESLGDVISLYPWMFALALACASAFIKSQAACLTALLPLGISLGIDPAVLVGIIPACYAYFFFPFYPSDLAAIEFDRTGTTRIGKYVLNHSFMIIGLTSVASATFVGYLISMAIN